MKDEKAYITVKRARIARAGVQSYSAQELRDQGIVLEDGKAFGLVYRPPEVVIKNKDKFANVPFVDNHTPVAVTPDNWRDFAIGFVSGNIDVEVFEDQIWVVGDVVFYDRKAYEAYQNGKVELSAQYDVQLGEVKDGSAHGCDAVVLDIPAVNHVALCDMARAGRNARVLDSVDRKMYGGINMSAKMLGGWLASQFGIGKTKDANFKFSNVLMDSVAKVHSLDEQGLTKEIDGVMAHVSILGDSEARGLLVGVVSDCFKHPVEVLAKKEAISTKIDELYVKCQAADAEVVSRIMDSGKEDEPDKEDGKDKKDKKDKEDVKEAKEAKDSADIPAIIDAAVAKAFAVLSDNIDEKIIDAVRKNLGLEKAPIDKTDQRVIPNLSDCEEMTDFSWIFNKR